MSGIRRLPETPEAIVALWAQVQQDLRAFLDTRGKVGKRAWARARARNADLPSWSLIQDTADINKRYNREIEGARELT